MFNYPLTSRMWHTIFLRCSNGNSFECPFTLRWLNTVLRAVKGNSSDGACFNQTNKHGGKKAIVHRRRFLKIYSLKFCDIRQIFYFYRILNNENFKMEVEQTNFVTHLIITVQLYYSLSNNPSVKIWSNKFQIVMINYSKLCASLQENLMSEFYVN